MWSRWGAAVSRPLQYTGSFLSSHNEAPQCHGHFIIWGPSEQSQRGATVSRPVRGTGSFLSSHMRRHSVKPTTLYGVLPEESQWGATVSRPVRGTGSFLSGHNEAPQCQGHYIIWGPSWAATMRRHSVTTSKRHRVLHEQSQWGATVLGSLHYMGSLISHNEAPQCHDQCAAQGPSWAVTMRRHSVTATTLYGVLPEQSQRGATVSRPVRDTGTFLSSHQFLLRYSRTIPHFMAPGGALSCSQGPANCPYPEPD